MIFSRSVFASIALVSTLRSASGAVDVMEQPDKVRVQIDGKLFTEYVFTGAPHVYFYPLLGPGGAKMTRDWPMQSPAGEEHDHPHHRSLWFAHGAVNGIDFWAEPASFGTGKTRPTGEIRHDQFLEVKSGEKEGVIRDRLKWVAPDGTVPLTSVQTFRVYERPDSERLFDFEIALVAGEKEVIMGDTKEGSMAMRLADSMRLEQPKKQPGEGRIVDDQGDLDGAVWGKHASWVDYSGPIDGKVLGVSFFDHPANPRHPTRWHARDYGLFAANPFCEHDMDKTKPPGAGDFTIAAGQTALFRYRFLIHQGDAAAAKVADRYAEYVNEVH